MDRSGRVEMHRVRLAYLLWRELHQKALRTEPENYRGRFENDFGTGPFCEENRSAQRPLADGPRAVVVVVLPRRSLCALQRNSNRKTAHHHTAVFVWYYYYYYYLHADRLRRRGVMCVSEYERRAWYAEKRHRRRRPVTELRPGAADTNPKLARWRRKVLSRSDVVVVVVVGTVDQERETVAGPDGRQVRGMRKERLQQRTSRRKSCKLPWKKIDVKITRWIYE